MTLVVVTHELESAFAVADRIAMIHQGKILIAGTADQVFDNPKTDYARALMAAAFNLEALAGVSD